MNATKYNEVVENLKNNLLNRSAIQITSEKDEYFSYLKCKANVKKMNKYSIEKDYIGFFNQVRFFQDFAGLDFGIPHASYNAKVEGSCQAESTPNIYCTFHLGSYRIINTLLLFNNIDFTLVVDNETIENSQSDFIEEYQKYLDRGETTSDFKVVNAEKGNIGLKMIREIKRGRSLVLYLDGNTGVGGVSRKDDKLVPVNFLGNKILARKGIAFMSYLLNVPIVPVISYRTNNTETNVCFHPSIIPDKTMERDAFCLKTTQYLFDLFASYLENYPEQWEGWLYVDRFLDKEAFTTLKLTEFDPNYEYIFNKDRFDKFIKDYSVFLFDNESYNCFSIPNALSSLIDKLEKEEIGSIRLQELLPEKLINQVVQLGVFIPTCLAT